MVAEWVLVAFTAALATTVTAAVLTTAFAAAFTATALVATLAATARAGQLQLVTTAKDAARLRNGAASHAEFLRQLDVLEIETAFDLEHAPTRFIDETLNAWRLRRIGG